MIADQRPERSEQTAVAQIRRRPAPRQEIRGYTPDHRHENCRHAEDRAPARQGRDRSADGAPEQQADHDAADDGSDRSSALRGRRHRRGEGDQLLRHATNHPEPERGRQQRRQVRRRGRQQREDAREADLDEHEPFAIEPIPQRQEGQEAECKARQGEAGDQADGSLRDAEIGGDQRQHRLVVIDVGHDRARDERHCEYFRTMIAKGGSGDRRGKG